MSTPETPILNPQVSGALFGFTLEERERYSPLVHMYIEDDELWHYKCSFDVAWLGDLETTVKLLIAAKGVLFP